MVLHNHNSMRVHIFITAVTHPAGNANIPWTDKVPNYVRESSTFVKIKRKNICVLHMGDCKGQRSRLLKSH